LQLLLKRAIQLLVWCQPQVIEPTLFHPLLLVTLELQRLVDTQRPLNHLVPELGEDPQELGPRQTHWKPQSKPWCQYQLNYQILEWN
jgi:hypothetical protein